jgi:hypothetical protein
MELKDTITMMTSGDEKERLKAEYWQAKIRYQEVEQKHKLKVEEAHRTIALNGKEPILGIPIIRECLSLYMLKEKLEQYIKALERLARMQQIDLNLG